MLGPELELHRQIEVLYSDHHGWLHGWLRRKLGNAFDAADLAHDTYLRILARGRKPGREESRQHLAQMANGLVPDQFRRRHIAAAYADAIAAQPEALVPSPEMRALIVEALMEIDAILASLPHKVRDAFLLCKLEGMGYANIAARLDVSVSSVEKYIARALLACCAAQFAGVPSWTAPPSPPPCCCAPPSGWRGCGRQTPARPMAMPAPPGAPATPSTNGPGPGCSALPGNSRRCRATWRAAPWRRCLATQ